MKKIKKLLLPIILAAFLLSNGIVYAVPYDSKTFHENGQNGSIHQNYGHDNWLHGFNDKADWFFDNKGHKKPAGSNLHFSWEDAGSLPEYLQGGIFGHHGTFIGDLGNGHGFGHFKNSHQNDQPVPTPEPATWMMLAVSLVFLLVFQLKKSKLHN